MKVAIVGIGIHPFGRTRGVSGREQGVAAARTALADAGVGFDAIQFAFGGSHAAGAADTLVADLGLTGLPFINVSNGCATGGSVLLPRAVRFCPASTTSGWSWASTSTRREPSTTIHAATARSPGTARPA